MITKSTCSTFTNHSTLEGPSHESKMYIQLQKEVHHNNNSIISHLIQLPHFLLYRSTSVWTLKFVHPSIHTYIHETQHDWVDLARETNHQIQSHETFKWIFYWLLMYKPPWRQIFSRFSSSGLGRSTFLVEHFVGIAVHRYYIWYNRKNNHEDSQNLVPLLCYTVWIPEISEADGIRGHHSSPQ